MKWMTNIKLGDLCKSCAGQIKVEDGELIDYIDISSIDNEKKKLIGFQTMPFGESPSRARKVVKKGSILVSTVRPNLNAIAVLENDTPNISVASTGFCILDCKDDVDNRFVFNFCKSRKFIDDMVSKATGASYPAVSDKIIRSALVPNYTYEEQCNISKVLDSISDIIDKREAELFSLDELIKARFVEMFGNPALNDKDWNVISVKELATKIGSGATPKGGKGSYREDGISLIRSMNVHNGYFEYKDLAYISDDQADKLSNVVIEENDVLLNITGASVARCCVVPCDVLPARVNQHVCIIRCKKDIVPRFLNCIMTDENYQKLLWEIAGSGATREAITKQQVEDLQIIMPPIELQEKFAEFAKQVDKSKVAVQKALDETKLLFDSLMQKYFG